MAVLRPQTTESSTNEGAARVVVSVSLTCYRCDRSSNHSNRTRCECGEPLWFEPAAPPSEAGIDHSGSDTTGLTESSMWRYAESLPIDSPSGLGRAVGGTPLLRCDGLAPEVDARLYVKDEPQNPTGSYKDRGSAVAVPHAIETSNDQSTTTSNDQSTTTSGDGSETIEAIGTVSYGNMAMSTAAHAASLGVECVVLVPADIPPERLAAIDQYGPTIVRVDGDYGALYADALDFSERLPVQFLLSDAPSRLSGYSTIVYEVAEQLAPEMADAIVIPASSGGFASGIWRGLCDLEAAGGMSSVPRLYVVQPAVSDPITRAFDAGLSTVDPLTPDEREETIARSVGNPAPPSGTRTLAAVRATGGAAVSVSESAIERAQIRFARRGGFCVEPAAALPLAGLDRLEARGEIDADDRIVLIPTGTGFKEIGTSAGTATGEPADGPPIVSRSSLTEALENILA